MNAESPAASAAPPWLRGRVSRWIFATDHRHVGVLWLALGGVGLALGGLLAVIAAVQTASADATVIGEGAFASLTTMQGTLLTYCGILPLALGLAVALVPLQLGARGIALPQVAAFGLWLGISGSTAVVLSSFATGDAPRSSWTTFPPVALAGERPGESARLMGLVLIGLSALLTAIALVATFRGRRAPGLTNERLPLFAQSAGIFAAALLVLAPVSLLGNLLLLLARENPGSFDWYLTEDGLVRGYGWVFGQAMVAIVVVPALGVAAEVIGTFGRVELQTRRVVSIGLVATAVLVALVPGADHVDAHTWAAVLALLAALPIGAVAGLLLLAGFRALRGQATTTPLPFALGALVLALGGLGLSLAFVVSHDDLRGTTFETARLALFWGAAFLALLGGVVYWWPKLFGRVLGATLTTVAAVVVLVSSLLLALGRLAAGSSDQPSHTGVILDDADTASLVGSVGVFGIALGIAIFALAQLRAIKGRRVGNDPWQGDTLEWYTASPPPPGNFTSLPPVTSARPLADLRQTLRERGAL